MQVHTFIAETAVQAVEQIRQKLGPQAVVLNVRKLPAEGLARLWQKPRIEVLATLPEPPAPSAPNPDALAELRQELAEIKQKVSSRQALPQSLFPPSEPITSTQISGCLGPENQTPADRQDAYPSGWRIAPLLESGGLWRVHVHQVLDEVRARLGEQPPESLAEELAAAREALIGLWPSKQQPASNFHVFTGPPGVGKTTVLSKWLAQAVLVEGRRARVWRLDGHVANTAESLSVFAEILGVPVERFRPEKDASDPAELVFVDLPGVNAYDHTALEDLARRLGTFPGAQVHLVLNAAYDAHLLLGQGRAFSAFPITDVILTHLDEEPCWGKLWDFVLGTNFTVGFLSAGQNLPGDFQPADPQKILARYLPEK